MLWGGTLAATATMRLAGRHFCEEMVARRGEAPPGGRTNLASWCTRAYGGTTLKAGDGSFFTISSGCFTLNTNGSDTYPEDFTSNGSSCDLTFAAMSFTVGGTYCNEGGTSDESTLNSGGI